MENVSPEVEERIKEAVSARSEFQREAIVTLIVTLVFTPIILLAIVFGLSLVTRAIGPQSNPIMVTTWILELREKIYGSIDPQVVRTTAIAILSVVVSGIFALVAQSVKKQEIEEQVKAVLWRRFVFRFLILLSLLLALLVLFAWISRPSGEGIDDLTVGSVAATAAVLFVLVFKPSSDVTDRYMRMGSLDGDKKDFDTSLESYFETPDFEPEFKEKELKSYRLLAGNLVVLWCVIFLLSGAMVAVFGGGNELLAGSLILALVAIATVVVLLFAIICWSLISCFSTYKVWARIGYLCITGLVFVLVFGVVQVSIYYRIFIGEWGNATWLLVVDWSVIPMLLLIIGYCSTFEKFRYRYLTWLFRPVWAIIYGYLWRGSKEAEKKFAELNTEIETLVDRSGVSSR